MEGLFRRLERAGDGAIRTKTALARELVRALSVHAAIEEELLYPALREAGVEADVLEALEEHHAVKLMLSELDAIGPRAPRFDAKVAVLAENVRRHVAEEEQTLLPRLQRALDVRQRAELGASLEAARVASPTRPHPTAPDEPPGIFVAGAAAAIYDRARDAAREGAIVLRAAMERAGARPRARSAVSSATPRAAAAGWSPTSATARSTCSSRRARARPSRSSPPVSGRVTWPVARASARRAPRRQCARTAGAPPRGRSGPAAARRRRRAARAAPRRGASPASRAQSTDERARAGPSSARAAGEPHGGGGRPLRGRRAACRRAASRGSS